MEYYLVAAVPEDAEWVNDLTVISMKPWVETSWETYAERQRYYELNSFSLQTTKIIIANKKRAGRISCSIDGNTFSLDNLHLLPTFHGSGLGTKIITDTINDAHAKNMTVELKCLKTNPVQNLYIRLGFSLINEDEKRLYYRNEQE